MPPLSVTLKRLNPAAMFGLALASTVSDFPTAFPYLAALDRLATSNLPDGAALLLLGLYNLLYILPLLILAGIYRLARHRLEGLQERIEGFFARHGRTLTVVFMYPIAVWFLYEAAEGLGWLGAR